MPNKTGQKIIEMAESQFNSTERINQRNNWELLSEFLTPNQYNNFNTHRSPGLKNTVRLYDSTGPKASKDLASVLNETLTNERLKFAKFKFTNNDLNNRRDSLDWLQQANIVFHDAVSDSNFSSEINAFYNQFTALGSSCLLVEEKADVPLKFGKLVFKSIHMSDMAWEQNHLGVVDTIYRRVMMTNRNVFEKYGPVVKDLEKQVKNSPDKERELIIHVAPRERAEVVLDVTGLAPEQSRPFVSFVVDKETGAIIEESGLFKMPYLCVRWDTMPDEVYGRGRGHIALPEVRTLNRIRELYLEALALTIRPPLKAVKRQLTVDPTWMPGSVNYVSDMNGLQPMNLGVDLSAAQFGMQEAEQKINSIFFIDKLFFAPREQTGEQTAAEVNERISQMGKVLGSTVGRLINELLQPMTERVYDILLRGNALPPLPESVDESDAQLEVDYVNPLSRSRRIEEVRSIEIWAQELALLANLGMTEALDKVDSDAVADLTAEIHGVPVNVIRTEKEIAQIRQSRAQQQKAQQQIEAGVAVADIQAKNAAASRTGGAQ